MKYELMATSPFVFLRGTCHLFVADLARTGEPMRSPLTSVCGDLHFENFGAYKGDNRLAYFDINDFDEATAAPCGWDVVRFLTSLMVGAKTLGVGKSDALYLCNAFLGWYAQELATGKPRWLERNLARGMVRNVLAGLTLRKRAALLAKRTETHRKSEPVLKVDGIYALPVSDSDRAKVTLALATFAAKQSNPRFFRVFDVARRIAGTGSLGIERYTILIEGKGAPAGYYLLDLKHQPGSALTPYTPGQKSPWAGEAARVIALQRRMQAISPAFLNEICIGDRSYVLRELMPREDRLDLDQWNGRLQRLEYVASRMGALAAWSHLRGAAWQDTGPREALIAFGADTRWQAAALDYAWQYAETVKQDWKLFREAFKDGALDSETGVHSTTTRKKRTTRSR